MVSLLILTIMLFMPFQIQINVSSANPLATCPKSCGSTLIHYPFGIGPGCSLPGFELTCNKSSDGSRVPFLWDTFPVLDIDLPRARIRVNNNISFVCMNEDISVGLAMSGTPYRINHRDNSLFVIGCNTIAEVTSGNESLAGCTTYGCYSQDSITNYDGGSCSGPGCCQTAILAEANSYDISIRQYQNDSRTASSSKQHNYSSSCAYAVITDSFKLNPINIPTYATDIVDQQRINGIIKDELSKQQMTLLLDWSIGNESCQTAKANRSSYACRSNHSRCLDSDNGPGYTCNCSIGYQGNPYKEGGCQGIPNFCPAFTRPKENTGGKCELVVPYVIGLIVGLGLTTGLSAFLLYFGVWKRIKLLEKRRLKKLKEKFFNQNRGFLLQQRIASDEDTTQRMRILSLDELEKATNKFDKALILGEGGHGEVYKGILTDQRVVAIKRSKIIDQDEIEQFINEVVILSQINHRNIVKLYGCCLETEVPLLVYEFISSGTLSNHLHAEPCSLTWNHRLRIAVDTARAIAYLHSSASISVLHRDIKSANILLDDYFTAKVSDFGASRSVEIDQTGTTTVVQGTFGYLDPEYFYTHRLTPKSDVYSFGVILAELLTKEKPNSSKMIQVGGLSTYFTSALREKCLFEILDPQIIGNEGQRTELEVVANLAEMCIRRNGEERPTMKEVEVQLEILWRSNQRHGNSCTSRTLEKRPFLLHDSPVGNNSTKQYSFEQELLSSLKLPR